MIYRSVACLEMIVSWLDMIVSWLEMIVSCFDTRSFLLDASNDRFGIKVVSLGAFLRIESLCFPSGCVRDAFGIRLYITFLSDVIPPIVKNAAS